MDKYGSGSKWMWFMAAVLAAFMAGCSGDDGQILGAGGASTGGPGATPAIIPGAVCTAAAGPLIPRVTSSDPTSGNPSATTSTTVVGGPKLITATFSAAMNPTTINSAPAGTLLTFTVRETVSGTNVPGTVAMNAPTNTIATFTTTAALLPATQYTATITQAAMSAAVPNTPLGCPVAWNFTTITPPATGAASVNLGRAAPMAIASAAGVINDQASNPPNTTINGDVVLDDLGGATANEGAICNAVFVDAAGGFGLCGGIAPAIAGTVISPSFPDAGITSGGIKTDLNAAYLSITPGILTGGTSLGCAVIGTGGGAGALPGCAGAATLPPGVYIAASGTSIGVTGILTLDGGGDLDARFVFQAGSTLTTAAGAPGLPGSQIVLTNGARASNVWWQVGSSATIGTFAVFRGNVLADTSITMGDQSTSCGRLLAGAVTVTGAFTFDGNTVSVPGHPSAPPGCQ